MLKMAGIQMSCSKDPQANLAKAVEMASLAADRGAKVIGFPQLFTLPWFAYEKRSDHFRLAEELDGPTIAAFQALAKQYGAVMLCSNAIANHLFIFRINRVGKEEQQQFYGKSFCVNPFGELVASQAGSKDAIIFSEINLDEVQETREIWPFFKDRRPDLYGELLQ